MPACEEPVDHQFVESISQPLKAEREKFAPMQLPAAALEIHT